MRLIAPPHPDRNLDRIQVAQRGLTWSSLHESVTPDFPFSAARVFIMISIDVVLYAVLALYLDKVRCTDAPI